MSEAVPKKPVPTPVAKPAGVTTTTATAPTLTGAGKDPEAPTVASPTVASLTVAQTQITPYKPPQITKRCQRTCKYQYLIVTMGRMTSLDTPDKDILNARYIQLLREFDYRCRCYAAFFHTMRLVVTVGSLLVPALLSVQYSDNYKDSMYWITWVISLAVTMSNGIATLLKVEKKYYYLHTTMELLYSEGWQFLSLTGKYSVGGSLLKPGEQHNHKTLFHAFCHYVEKIKLRQVEEEYYKAAEAQTAYVAHPTSTTGVVPSRTGGATSADSMNLLTPLEKNLSELAASLPKETFAQIMELLEGFRQTKPGP
jgi:hypothetical protein